MKIDTFPILQIVLPALSVIISFVVLYLIHSLQQRDYGLLLAFSGAFLLSLTLFELLPTAYSIENTRTAGVFIAAGILLQILLEFFSKGAEHGHIHGFQKEMNFPWLLFISLCIHAFLEGIPLGDNRGFVWGIVIHKVPVVLILGSFLLKSQLKTSHVWFFILLFAFMTPIGTLFSQFNPLREYYPYLLALVIGVVLHVSTIILFESSKNHSFNRRKLAVIFLGMILAYFL